MQVMGTQQASVLGQVGRGEYRGSGEMVILSWWWALYLSRRGQCRRDGVKLHLRGVCV